MKKYIYLLTIFLSMKFGKDKISIKNKNISQDKNKNSIVDDESEHTIVIKGHNEKISFSFFIPLLYIVISVLIIWLFVYLIKDKNITGKDENKREEINDVNKLQEEFQKSSSQQKTINKQSQESIFEYKEDNPFQSTSSLQKTSIDEKESQLEIEEPLKKEKKQLFDNLYNKILNLLKIKESIQFLQKKEINKKLQINEALNPYTKLSVYISITDLLCFLLNEYDEKLINRYIYCIEKNRTLYIEYDIFLNLETELKYLENNKGNENPLLNSIINFLKWINNIKLKKNFKESEIRENTMRCKINLLNLSMDEFKEFIEALEKFYLEILKIK
jgi:hypothetical protein